MKVLDQKVNIRLNGLVGPVTLRVLPRVDIDFDENGEAEVQKHIADRLLSPAHAGAGFELVPVQNIAEVKNTEVKTVKQPRAKAIQTEQTEEKEFAKSIMGS